MYIRPQFSVQQVNAAGKTLVAVMRGTNGFPTPEEFTRSLDVLNNWRVAHSYPLNAFHMTLKNRAASLSPSALTAQRIKRLESIYSKLVNEEKMKVSQMQDIAGCRAIVPTLANVYALRDLYIEPGNVAHEPTGEKNYLAFPKPTGYRGIHLKYKYAGRGTSLPWDKLKVEIQLRTLLQHRWATAVEAAGTFTHQAMKSNRGKREWLRFFSLMSSIFALREGAATVPDTSSSMKELCQELKQLNGDHRIVPALSQIDKIVPAIEKQKGARYFLIRLDPEKLEVNVTGFGKMRSNEAAFAYTQAEKALPEGSPIQIVLVSVDSIAALRKAYPNYFLDTQDFLREVEKALGSG
jgi:ppGpp synthetase/RelA/SpoT-type nucleotidyltranferase